MLYTDGAGLDNSHEDAGFGGYGSVVISLKHHCFFPVCGMSTHMSTGRAEFTAVLASLQAILKELRWDVEKAAQASLRANRATVLVVSDREDVVGAINRVFARTSYLDLWKQYEWYEELFLIEAVHVKRETNVLQSQADRLASMARIVIRDYVRCLQSTNPLL